MNGRVGFALTALALTAACGVRTPLRPTDALLDDDPWLKGEAGPDTRRGAGLAPLDGGAGGAEARPGDAARTASEGAVRAVRDLAKVLWESEPEPRHLELAQSGRIRTASDLENVVREMLKDMRARRGVGRFFRWWLHLDEIKGLSKDPQQFPSYPKVASFLADEVERFGVAVTLGDGLYGTLMAAAVPYGDMQVSALVGDDGSDKTRRAGLLARPGLLALHARSDRPSPTARGSFIRQDVLCTPLPPHPSGVDLSPPPQPSHLTNRQHYQQLIVSPSCSACHDLMDPIGYGLENYDAVGRFRTTDHGQPVDASGSINGTSSGLFRFVGAVQLGNILTSNREAWRCIVTKWVSHLRGSPPSSGDPLLARAVAAFEGSGGNMREVIVTVLGATPL